jgi:hypothetical protein
MAFATETFSDVNPFSGFTLRNPKSRNILSSTAIIGACTVAFAWVVATVFTMQTMVMTVGSASIAETSLGPKSIALVAPERRMHIAALSTPSKAERQRAIDEYAQAVLKQNEPPTVAVERMARVQQPAVTPEQTAAIGHAVPDGIRKQLIMRLAMANAAASSPARDIAAFDPHKTTAVASIAHPQQNTTVAYAPTQTKDDAVVASAVPVPSAAPVDASAPQALSQDQVLASTEPDDGFAAIVPPIPTARPDDADSVMTASIATTTDSDDDDNSDASNAFGLVLSNPDSAVPLPMARPDGSPRDALPAGRSRNAPEQALAYARTEDDDDDDSMPSVKKAPTVQRATNGVAIYDIEAGTVYLPSGERLEAHSGIGNMRDNPRFVNQKNRGPTPPHTYALTLRESLFHGVQALRLTPLGGQGAVYNRVGLLAHTYMLGRAGDSNGCVSFKDYRRFLAAYQRGEIRKLVVVPRMSAYSGTATASAEPQRSLFGRLFSR